MITNITALKEGDLKADHSLDVTWREVSELRASHDVMQALLVALIAAHPHPHRLRELWEKFLPNNAEQAADGDQPYYGVKYAKELARWSDYLQRAAAHRKGVN